MLRLHLNLSIQLFTACAPPDDHPRTHHTLSLPHSFHPSLFPPFTLSILHSFHPSLSPSFTLCILHSFPVRPSALRSASPILAFSPRPPCLPSPAHPLCLVATPSPYLSHPPLLSILNHSYSHFTPYPTLPLHFYLILLHLSFCKGPSLRPLLSHLKAVTVSYAPVFAPSDR
jgi:hypothetical protein